jgi:Flp pilus assembly protein TadB
LGFFFAEGGIVFEKSRELRRVAASVMPIIVKASGVIVAALPIGGVLVGVLTEAMLCAFPWVRDDGVKHDFVGWAGD